MAPLLKHLAAAASLVLVLAACGAGSTSGRAVRQESGAASRFTPTPAAVDAGGEEPTTVRIHRLRLETGGQTGGDRVRIMIGNASPEIRVTISGPIDQDENAVTVCAVTDETSVPPSTHCVLPVADRAVDLPSAPGVKGAEIALAGRSALLDLDEIALTYTEENRRVRVLLPNLQPAGDDPGCLALGCPALEVTPARSGQLTGQASWEQPGSGILDIRTAVPVPSPGVSPTPATFRVVSSSASSSTAGPGSVSISSTVQSEQRSLLALTNNGSGPLITPVLDATWP